MSKPIIEIRNIGKCYKIGAHKEKYLSLRDEVTKFASRLVTMKRQSEQDFWALKGVSFNVQVGEAVGIIGRNGAGKSTLLKILSQITPPTEGRITMRGRVASLLEVGTGFHPELTGRENIFLNGTILGMTRREVTRKFDEIVAFAEVEKFLDTPVKRYSSGMYVRLAFAVAANLEPEILLVDEVLAVGDSAFQKKCIGKMGEVSGEGRTVLFVSHNMSTITRLCNRVVLLNEGSVAIDGDSADAIHHYLRSNMGTTAHNRWDNIKSAPGDDFVKLISISVKDLYGKISENIDIRQPVTLEMEYEVIGTEIAMRPWFVLYNEEGICPFATTDLNSDWNQKKRRRGRYCSRVKIPENLLAEGNYIITSGMAAAGGLTSHFAKNDSISFNIYDSLDGDSSRGEHAGPFPGVVRPMLEWFTEQIV